MSGEGKKLGDLITLEKGRVPSNPTDSPLALPYVTPDYLRGAEGKLDYFTPNANDVQLVGGEVVVLCDGSNAGEIFRGRPGILSSTMAVIDSKGKIDAGFLYVFLKFYEPYLKSQTAGSGIPHLDKQLLGRLLLPALSSKEQKHIANIVDRIESITKYTEALITKHERLRAGLLHDLLTYGIDQEGQIRSEQTHEFKDSPTGRIPSEWAASELNEVAIIEMGQSPPGFTYNDEGKGIPLINGPVEFGKRFPRTIQWTTSPVRYCDAGDVLFCVRGSTTGRMNISDGIYCIGRGVAAIRGRSGKTITPYIELQLIKLAEKILSDARGSGSTFPSINGVDLGKFKLPVPSIQEQHSICHQIAQFRAVEEKITSRLSKLRLLKTGLMQDLLNPAPATTTAAEAAQLLESVTL